MGLSTNLHSTLKSIGRKIKWGAIHYYNAIGLYYFISQHRKRVLKKARSGKTINVLFLLQYPEMWNSEKSVYEAMLSGETFHPMIVTVPKQKGVNHSNYQFMEANEASLFCEKQDLPFFDGCENGVWKDIGELAPDFIFAQRPYDECMPEHLALKELSKAGIVCYIPYGYDFSDIHFPIEYNINFFNSVSCYFADSSDSYRYVCSKYIFDSILGIRRSFDLGYPRFDLVRALAEDVDHRTTVLWIPRWSIDEANDRSYFFDYLELLISYFESRPEKKLIIRPHPLMFKNFVEKGVMTSDQVDLLMKRINSYQNISFDNNSDYLQTFEGSDLMISDFSSLMIEFFVSLKPIIFCGENVEYYTNIGKEMMEGIYTVRNGDELTYRIDSLMNQYNEYYERNKKMISSIFNPSISIGQSIAQTIAKTYLER